MLPLPDLSKLDHAAKDRLILALVEHIEAQSRQIAALLERVAQLEAKLGQPPKTPDNSSTPPSRAAKEAVTRTGRPAGGKKRRKRRQGSFRALHPEPSHIRDIRLSSCPCCAASLPQAGQKLCEAYDNIDLPPIMPVVTRINLYGGHCPNCARRFKAPAPQDMLPGSPFGANLRALVFYLRYTQAIGLDRLSRLLEECFGVVISQGALVNMLAKAAPCFADQFERIRTDLLSGASLASDETGLRIGGRNGWLWVVHHGDSAAFIADHSRSKRVLEDFLGAHRPAFWLSDRFGAQKGFAQQGHQYCLAHLIRDAQYAIDAGDKLFAPGFMGLIKRACRIGRKRPELSNGQLQAYHRRFREKLGKLLILRPTHPEGIALHKAIARSRDNLFVFLVRRDLEPTNNASERALRPAVTFRKITNGFRTDWGADVYAHVRSVIETARRRAIPLLNAISITLQGKSLLIKHA